MRLPSPTLADLRAVRYLCRVPDDPTTIRPVVHVRKRRGYHAVMIKSPTGEILREYARPTFAEADAVKFEICGLFADLGVGIGELEGLHQCL